MSSASTTFNNTPVTRITATAAAVAAGLAILAARANDAAPLPNVTIAKWVDLHRGLPTSPVTVTNSPMAEWWRINQQTWSVENIADLAATTEAGLYNVTLQWQEAAVFVPHDNPGDEAMTAPLFSHGVRLLRDALGALWADTKASLHYYVAADIEDFPPAVARHALAFLPAGCVWDTRWEGGAAGVWRPDVPDEERTCRGLRSNLWLASAGTTAATHFDLSHNLFFQAAGTKKFVLAPPSAHRHLRLHPSWHGSHLAAQSRPGSHALARLGAVEATLAAGDVLYLPPGWFHSVTSLTQSVGLNLWTDSLANDAWHVALSDAERMGALLVGCIASDTADGLGKLLRCARGRLVALHVALHSALNGDHAADAPDAPDRLARQVAQLLAARYDGEAWDTRVPAFRTERAQEARASVARVCAMRTLGDAEPGGGAAAFAAEAPPLAPTERVVVREYAAALLKVEDAGLRELLLDDLVEEIALFVLEQAAEVAVGQRLGPAAVEVFLRECLSKQIGK